MLHQPSPEITRETILISSLDLSNTYRAVKYIAVCSIARIRLKIICVREMYGIAIKNLGKLGKCSQIRCFKIRNLARKT